METVEQYMIRTGYKSPKKKQNDKNDEWDVDSNHSMDDIDGDDHDSDDSDGYSGNLNYNANNNNRTNRGLDFALGTRGLHKKVGEWYKLDAWSDFQHISKKIIKFGNKGHCFQRRLFPYSKCFVSYVKSEDEMCNNVSKSENNTHVLR